MRTRKGRNEPPSGEVVSPDQPSDYTARSASRRALYINFGFIKLGTTDPLQGAAIFLSITFLLVAIVVIFLGAVMALNGIGDWMETALAWIGAPLSVVIGVAIGRGGDNLVIEKSENENNA